MAKTFKEYLEEFGSSKLFGFDGQTGQIIPQTSNVLSAIKELMNDVFDQNLAIEPETPAGRLCEALAMSFARFCAVTAAYANQINPHYATGQMLDAIGSLFSITRTGASSTVINIVASGSVGTIVPAGAIIKDAAGNEFAVNDSMTIGAGGSVTGCATCTKSGNIVVDVGTVTTIVSTVPGWLAVTNTSTVTAGDIIESDEHFRDRVLLSRWTGTAFVEAIRAEIERLDSIDSVAIVENGNNKDMYYTEQKTFVDTQPASGKYIKLVAHSICAIVYGASLTEDKYNAVGSAIYSTKPAGCGFTKLDSTSQGSTKGTVVTTNIADPVSGALYPITFNTPIIVQFSCDVAVGRGSFDGADEELIENVKEAIKSWANGETPFVDGLSLGQSLYSFEIGAAISDVIPSIQVKNVSLKVDGTQMYSKELFIYEIGSLDIASSTVTIS